MAKIDMPEVRAPNEWDRFIEKLPYEKRVEIEGIQTEGEFLIWALKNGVENPYTLWSQRYDSLFSPDSLPEDNENKEPEGKKSEYGHRRRRIEYREPTYEEFQESAREEAEKKAGEWENNPNPEVATNRQQAYEIALTKTHDDFVKNYEHFADKWAKGHNDLLLASALERKRLEKEKGKKEEGVSKLLKQEILAERQSRMSQLRSKLASLERGRAQNASSAGVRAINRHIARPASNASRAILGNIGKNLSSGMLRAGLMISQILARLTALALFSISIPGILLIAGILFLIIVIMLILKVIFPSIGDSTKAITSPYPGIGYNVYGPKFVNKGQNFTHRIEFTYNNREAACSLENITLVDIVPSGTTVVEEQTTGNFAKTDKTVEWKLSPENVPYRESSIVKFYHFEIAFNSKDNLTAQNGVYIKGCGDPIIPDIKQLPPSGDGQTGLYEGADSLPSSDTCGEYAEVMSDLSKSWPEMGENTNFGDPVCSYKPEKFNQLLERTETKTENIPFWKDIVGLEGAIMTVDNLRDGNGKIIRHTNGPFGKFQMSRSTPPGKKWTEVGPRGDTTWQKQIENAVGYNKSLAQSNNNFGYWGSAMCLCWWPKYRTQSYCKDIVSKGPNSITGPRAPAGNNCPTNTGLTCNTAVRCENDKASEIGKRGPRQ